MDHVDDVHICGRCKAQFTSIEVFFGHKRTGCQTKQSTHPTVDTSLLRAATSFVNPAMTIASTPTSIPSTTTTTRKQRRKPILLASTPKVAQPVAPSNATPAQPCDPSTSLSAEQNFNDLAPTCSPGLPQTGSDTLTPSTARESLRIVGNCTSKQSTTTDGTKTEGKSKVKGEKCYKCLHEGCDFATAHLKDIIRHKRIHTGDRPFSCSFCQRRFTRKDKLQLHIRTHNGQKPFRCELCTYAAVDGGSLKKHMRTHTKERPFKCQICSYASRNSSQLTTHLRIHTGDTPFHCQQCSAKFKINTDLRRHLRIHTGEKPFKCSFCPYASALNSNLKSHIKNNHLREKKFQCEECSFTCCTKRQLRQHERTHPSHNPVKCLECGFLCQNKRAFRRHKRVHSKEKPQMCPHCSFTAKYHSQVAYHMKKSHPDLLAKPKQPRKVTKQKKSKETGKSERRRKPNPSTVQLNGKKPYKCDECKDSFMRKESYLSHMRQHKNPSIESTALAVMQLQQRPLVPTTCTVPTSPTHLMGSTCMANSNQNNNSILSELNPTASSCTNDIEMLLNVINSQAPVNAVSGNLDPGVNARNSAPKQPHESTTQALVSTQLVDSFPQMIALPKRPKHGTSVNNNSSIGSLPPHSITIIQPEQISGDRVTLEVISHSAVGESSPGTLDQANTGLNISGQQFVLRQLPVVRNQPLLHIPQLQHPESQVPPTVQPANQQMIRNPLNQTTPQLPVPISLSVPHRGFLPSFNRPVFSVSHSAVGGATLTQSSQPQGLPNPMHPQGFLQPPPPVPTVNQQVDNTSLLGSSNLQADLMQADLQCTTLSSTVPQVHQPPSSAQQHVYSNVNQFQTGIQQSQVGTSPALLPSANMLHTFTKFPSQASNVDSRTGQLHVMSQHQLQDTRQHHPNHQPQTSAQATTATQLIGALFGQHVANHPPQVPSQQQQRTVEPVRHHSAPPHNSILHAPQLAPITACSTFTSPSSVGDVNLTSLRVMTAGAIIPATQPQTTTSI
ncbi:uncharacterized protein LOC110975654 isoform X2 [Acanthaster planci]|nr:uncharacterized protein LOC110975654 isoform X2 [Acanthaster planci]XP_022084004.1 uncharacterized protein LOC110975654 isoform X2 [Acanthaster planci]